MTKFMNKSKNKAELTIVIVSFNTKDVLSNCLDSIKKVQSEAKFDVIVSDNGSTDGTLEELEKNYKWVKLIKNNHNLGFAKGNNKAKRFISSDYVLFLNSDTVVHKNAIIQTLSFMKQNREVGALTCKVVLPDKSFDKDTIRSFPTPWVALSHFSGLDRIFPTFKLFSRYWYGYVNKDSQMDVDVVQGAFSLMPKKVLDQVGWFDEDYFLDGEDIDLCWKVKQAGFRVIYYPQATITHIKKASKKGKRSMKTVMAGVNSMEIFYKKRLWSQYPIVVNVAVLGGIKILKILRRIKYYI